MLCSCHYLYFAPKVIYIKSFFDDPIYHDYTKENYSLKLLFSFITNCLFMVRLVPLDVIIQTETGKVVISKILEMDAEMMAVDTMVSETGIVACKV